MIDHYEPHIVTAQDYYPFGMLSRAEVSGSSKSYRFGFNGKENDNEVKGGLGNQQDYGMRISDPRIGRFLSVDPLTKDYPWYTPYQFAGNKPIWATDLDGLEENGASSYIHKPFPTLNNTPKSTSEKSAAGMNLSAFKMDKWSYNGTTWVLPQTKIETFQANVFISGWNQTLTGLETGSKVFSQQGRKELRKETVRNVFKFFQWVADNADEPMDAVMEKLTDVNLWEDLTASYLMGKTVFNALEPKFPPGSGPTTGVLEVSSKVKSVNAFKNYNPVKPIEFVYDPTSKRFLVGKPNYVIGGLSGHEKLASLGQFNWNKVVGGMFKRGLNGEIMTNESSGHFHQNWTDEIRKSFKKYLESQTGQKVNHSNNQGFN